MIYKVLLLLLQICFTIIDTLRQVCCRSHSALRSYDRQRDSSRNKEKNFLKTCSNQLSKLPSHLSIIIGPEESALEDKQILQLITYALWMKIDFISLYDTRLGKCNCNLLNMELPKHMRLKKLGKSHLLLSIDQFCGENITLDNGNVNGYKNGSTFNTSIQIFEIKPFEGHTLIGDVCRDLFKERDSNRIKERTLLTRQLDEELTRRLWKCKDPELCIIISKHMCTFGMLPWQMRFTEFYLHQEGNFFDASTFAKILFQYARCEQRWGK